MLKLTTLTGVAALAALTACGSAGDISLRNPNYFMFKVSEQGLSGSYNPAGYDSALVQNQIKGACESKQIASYGETAGEDGLTRFSATCSGPAVFARGLVEVERTPDGNYMFEAYGS